MTSIDWDRDPVARLVTAHVLREIDLRHRIAAGREKLAVLLACARTLDAEPVPQKHGRLRDLVRRLRSTFLHAGRHRIQHRHPPLDLLKAYQTLVEQDPVLVGDQQVQSGKNSARLEIDNVGRKLPKLPFCRVRKLVHMILPRFRRGDHG